MIFIDKNYNGLYEVKINDAYQLHHRIVLEKLELLVAQVAIDLHQFGLARTPLHNLHS